MNLQKSTSFHLWHWPYVKNKHKTSPSILYIIWPMHLQSLKLLCPTLYEEMHLQEIFDFLGQGHMKTLPATSCELWTSKVWCCYNPRLRRRDAFTRKYIIWPWPWGQGHRKCCPMPHTSCDLCTYKVWNYYVKWFRRRCIYKKMILIDLWHWPQGQDHTKCCPVPSTSCDLFNH